MRQILYSASEACSAGHPDMVADRISDAVLQAYYEQDKDCHVACETMVTTDFVLLAGEVKSTATVDVEKVVRDTIRDLGYTGLSIGFDADTVKIENRLHEQSADIDMGVSKETIESQGAGDQGFMIGFACNETAEYMPLALMIARDLCAKLTEVRESGESDILLPDGKAQVVLRTEFDDEVEEAEDCTCNHASCTEEAGCCCCSMEDMEGDAELHLDTIVVSNQHKDVPIETVREEIMEKVVRPVIAKHGFTEDSINKIFINPTGKFVIGGPDGDTGLTGRKLCVENYGNAAGIGGGASAGKDLSKVDRSGAYFARYIAKNIVAAGLAEVCQVEVSYAIGVAEPTSIQVTTFGTGMHTDAEISEAVMEIFDGRPGKICEWLHAANVNFNDVRRTLAYGNDIYPWEKTDKVSVLQEWFD